MKFELNKRVLASLGGYFFKGIVLAAPIYFIVCVVSFGIHKIDNIIKFRIPGIGLAILVITTILLGYFGSTFIVNYIFSNTEKLVKKIPFIGDIYSSFKEILRALVSNKKFNKPVLLKTETNGNHYKLGFITQEDLSSIGMPNSVAIYVPDAYSLAGKLYIVDKDDTKSVEMSSADAMKFVMSGGITEVRPTTETPNNIIG